MSSENCEGGFLCPSGCISREACSNIVIIAGLAKTSGALGETVGDPTQLAAIRAVDGHLGSVAARVGSMESIDAALMASCGLWQDARKSCGDQEVPDAELPPID